MKKIALAACVSLLLATGPAISQDAVPGNPAIPGLLVSKPATGLHLVSSVSTFKILPMRTLERFTT